VAPARAMTFRYDDVPYDSEACTDAHPAALATIARLAGLDAAPAATARVLDIGCGNGENLLAAAAYLPEASFVGFDLSKNAIAAGQANALPNVRLFVSDIESANDLGSFDYVVAHGMLSWVPEEVRRKLLALMRASLAPNGIGFIDCNALPGWEMRRALRELARDATRALGDPAAKVAETMKLVSEIARAKGGGFLGALASAAREYADHIARATPPDAPFSRYVFHDLLADCNDPFSFTELETRLSAARLRLISETPLRQAPGPFTGPFLQVLVQRDDAPAPTAISAERVLDLDLWADFLPIGGGAYRTTNGAVVRPVGDEGLARAVRSAPGFVAVRELADDDTSRHMLAEQLLAGFREGVFTLTADRPPCTTSATDAPRVADYVRARAERAVAAGAKSAVLTNAIHRSFRVPRSELEIIRTFDGRTPCSAEELVDRLRRHLFLVPG
jgi:SAM-dependent methyltransferase